MSGDPLKPDTTEMGVEVDDDDDPSLPTKDEVEVGRGVMLAPATVGWTVGPLDVLT